MPSLTDPSGTDLAALGVGPHHNAAGNFRAACFREIGIGQHSGTQDHPCDAGSQPAFHRAQVADAAAKLDRKIDGGTDGFDRGAVGALAGKGAVEIDTVQIFKTLAPRIRAPAPPGPR